MFRILLLGLLWGLPALAQTPDPILPEGLLGRWAGASIEAGTPRLFELDFSRSPDGQLHTELTLPYNAYDRFAYDFHYEPGGRYDGLLTAGLFGDTMRLVVDLGEGHLRGTVVVGDSVTAYVHLQRVPRYPLPAFQESERQFVAGADTLAGSLYLPEGVRQPPAVLLVAGRGYGSRAGMALWAKHFARNGIAAFAFDARGTGRSTGARSTITAEDRVEEVEAALDLLMAQADLGPVGVLGNSAAGWFLPSVAAGRPEVAFVITLVGPAVSLADQQAQVTQAFMRASGEPFTPEEYAAAYAYQRETVRLAQEDASWAAFEAINTPARAARWAAHAYIPESLEDGDLDYFRRRRGFTTPAWEQVRVPVLAIFAERDLIVPPADNVPLLEAALAANEDATILVLEGANHSLARPAAVVGEGAWPDRYYRPWTRSARLYETLVEWVRARFILP